MGCYCFCFVSCFSFCIALLISAPILMSHLPLSRPLIHRSGSRGSCSHAALSQSPAVQNGAVVNAPPSTNSNGAVPGGGGGGGGNVAAAGERSRQGSLASDTGSYSGTGSNPLFLNNNWSVADGGDGSGSGAIVVSSSSHAAQTPVAVLSNGKGSISNISNLRCVQKSPYPHFLVIFCNITLFSWSSFAMTMFLFFSSLSSEKSASKYVVDSKRVLLLLFLLLLQLDPKNSHKQRAACQWF